MAKCSCGIASSAPIEAHDYECPLTYEATEMLEWIEDLRSLPPDPALNPPVNPFLELIRKENDEHRTEI